MATARQSLSSIFLSRKSIAGFSCVVLALVLVPLGLLLLQTITGSGAELRERWSFLEARVFDRLVNSVVLALLTTSMAVILGLPMAVLLHRFEFAGRRILGFLYALPLLIPAHMHCIAWMRVIGNTSPWAKFMEKHGVLFDVRRGFLEIGGEATLFPGAAWVMASAFWPFVTLLVSSGFAHLSTHGQEAALLARGRRAALFSITLPLLRPHVITGAFLVFLFSVGCYPIPSLLNTPTIMQEIWFPAGNVDVKTAAVVSLPLVLCTLVSLLAILFLQRRSVSSGVRESRTDSPLLRPRSWQAGLAAWLLFSCTCLVPLALLLQKAGPPSTYRSLWQTNIPENVKNSLVLSLTSAAFLLASAAGIALFARSLSRRGAWTLELLTVSSFAFPAIVVGVAFNLFWSKFQKVSFIDDYVYNGPAIAVLANVALFLPFCVRAMSAALHRIPSELLDAARFGGASYSQRTARITLPLARSGLGAAFVLGFILSLGELAAGILVSPGRWQSAQVRIFNMIHFARDEEVAALCILMVCVGLVPLALHCLAFNKKLEVL